MSLDFSSLFWIFIAIMVLQWGDGMPCDAHKPSVQLKSHTRRVLSR